ncbi:MAG: NTP transferase domain-containing protein [Candidatus Cloacimonetes bacterium]|nr:NTP transferase domain-containing protein [Candidatus Cloacimonadota bacterium]
MKAVIIAAGCGSRLKDYHQGIPKSLLSINGKTIINDILDKIRLSGITEIIVITGFQNKVLEKHLSNLKSLELIIKYIHNPRWKESNGISVLCAEDHISKNEEFVLLMSDHLFSADILHQIVKTRIQKDEGLLALDFKIDKIPDLDDGMKIQCTKQSNSLYKIDRFGKQLAEFDAIDTGIFKFNHSFFEILDRSIEHGKSSLSDSCNLLSADGKMLGLDIKNDLWLDIDTPEMLDQHEILTKLLL